MKFKFSILLFFLLFALHFSAWAIHDPEKQEDEGVFHQALNKQRLKWVASGFSVSYGSGMMLLHKAWYKKENQTAFHFYNDLNHWNQLDKAGHLWASFHQGRVGIDAFKWIGFTDKESIWMGGMLGIVLQAPIEVFDGFSRGYGASWSDFGANVAGSAALIAQHLAWNETRVMCKFSFHSTPFAPLRPHLLGNNLPEQILKDYNGQSYWLSLDLSSFLSSERRYPKWLNIAAGYGASGMAYGNPFDNRVNGYSSYRRFFISPDINLQNLPIKNKMIKKVFYVLSAFRIPMPAIEFNTKKQLIFHPVYF